MAFDTIRLEKGMYRESGKSFTQVLESLDPSEAYKGTPLRAPMHSSASSSASTSA